MSGSIVIVGGGAVGLACAVLLAREPAVRRRALRITIIEQHRPAPPPPTPGLRVFAISPASQAVLASAGGWEGLTPGDAAPYRHMQVWQGDAGPGAAGSIRFDAADLGRSELGHIVANDSLRWLLWSAAASEPAIELVTGALPTTLDVSAERALLEFADGRQLEAALVIGADGADSWVRRTLGVTVSTKEYAQQALVPHLDGERPHHGTAFQAFLPTGPVALLPLADGRSSLVWSVTDEQAGALKALDDVAFAERLTSVMGSARGALKVTTPRAALPLAASHTHRYTGARFALIGDAAHQVHPLAGQGVNLGLLDAAALAETLGRHLEAGPKADPGDPLALRRYERWRKGDNLLTLATMDALHRLFTSRVSVVSRAGALALAGVDRLPALKGLLAAQAMGQNGDLPRAARLPLRPSAG